jgi:hypothetical protein
LHAVTSRSELRRISLRWLALGWNSDATTRTEMQAAQSAQDGRYATPWLRRKPIRPSASFSSAALAPASSVNTFRSVRPGR